MEAHVFRLRRTATHNGLLNEQRATPSPSPNKHETYRKDAHTCPLQIFGIPVGKRRLRTKGIAHVLHATLHVQQAIQHRPGAALGERLAEPRTPHPAEPVLEDVARARGAPTRVAHGGVQRRAHRVRVVCGAVQDVVVVEDRLARCTGTNGRRTREGDSVSIFCLELGKWR